MLVMVFFNACQKVAPVIEQPTNLPSQTTNTSQQTVLRDESDERLYATLNSIALGLLKPAQNTTFRDFVHSKAAEQFDGDDNVLLKTLQESSSETGIDFTNEIIEGINIYEDQILNNTLDYGITNNEININSGVMAFPYDSDRRFYFQVYIPNIDNVDLNSMPVIAPEMDEDNDCNILGYQLNANGSVSIIQLTESYASSHLVWIVSINETVDNNGNQRLGIHKQDTKATHERGFDYKEVFLNKIKISDKKECWLCGRADISFMAVQTNGCGFSFETIIPSNCMKKVGNSDLNTWLDVTLNPHNFTFDPLQLPGTDFFEQHQFLHYLIYEEDANTNANKKNRKWSNQHSSVTLSGNQPIYAPSCSLTQSQTYVYFSKDSPYWTTGTDFPVAYHELPLAASNTIWYNYTNIGSGSGGQFEIISKKATW